MPERLVDLKNFQINTYFYCTDNICLVKLSKFLKLNYLEQAEIVWEGNFVNKITEKGTIFLLYNIGDFFIEIMYQDDKSIATFKVVNSSERLLIYVESIKLDEFKNLG